MDFIETNSNHGEYGKCDICEIFKKKHYEFHEIKHVKISQNLSQNKICDVTTKYYQTFQIVHETLNFNIFGQSCQYFTNILATKTFLIFYMFHVFHIFAMVSIISHVSQYLPLPNVSWCLHKSHRYFFLNYCTMFLSVITV